MTKLLAFHGDPAIKAKYLARVEAHRAADNLVRGTGWNGHKGCAIGCTLERYDHNGYEIELGIPAALARHEDYIFEALPQRAAMDWPRRFLAAITPGADLSQCMGLFLIWTLTDPEKGVRRYLPPQHLADFDSLVSLIERDLAGEPVTGKEWAAAAAADKLIEIVSSAPVTGKEIVIVEVSVADQELVMA